MITVEPPYYQYEGMVILRDHIDPQTYYYLPNNPHFSRIQVDEDTSAPAVRFLKFRHDLDDWDPDVHGPPGGGLLMADVDLSYTTAFLEDAAEYVKQQAGLADRPNLVSPLWESGTVRFMLLGQTSQLPGDDDNGDGDGDDNQADNKWVTSFAAAGVPSLYGDNRAIFQAELTPEAATLLEASFNSGVITPIGVIYELKFLAMRPAFRVQVKANWEEVYHHFSERFALDLIVVDVDISEVLDELVQNGTIEIITEINDPAAEEQAQAAQEELKALILDNFFESKLSPDPRAGNTTANDVVNTIADIRRIVHPSGGYSRIEIDTSEIRSFSGDVSYARAVERTIAPQAHLSVLWAEAGLVREDIIGEPIDLDDPFYDDFELEVVSTKGWAEDGIESISGSVTYGDDSDASSLKSFSFAEGGARETLRWSFDQQRGFTYTYEWNVIFNNGLGLNRLVQAPAQQRGGPLVVNPRGLFRSRTLKPVVLRTLSFDRYPTVEVAVRYTGPDGFEASHLFLLSSASKEPEPWRLRIGEDWPEEVEYKTTLHRAGKPPLELGWTPTTDQVIPIGDPLLDGLDVLVRAQRGRGELESIYASLEYRDADGVVQDFQTLIFEGDALYRAQRWSVPVADLHHLTYRYQQTVFLADGEVLQGPWLETDTRLLVLGEEAARRWPVEVRLTGDSFEDAGITSIEVTLRYTDEASDLSYDGGTTLAGLDDVYVWPIRLLDMGRRDVAVTLRYARRNGTFRTHGPFTLSDRVLVFSTNPEAPR